VPRGYVNDYGNMISPSVEADLAAKLKNFEETDSTQLVILTVSSLRVNRLKTTVSGLPRGGRSVKGQRQRHLFLVSREDRKMRIEVGRGLEGKLTDLTAGRIIDLVVKPKFKVEDYDGGFTAGVSALIDATRENSRPTGQFFRGPGASGSIRRRDVSTAWAPNRPGFFVFFATMARSRARHARLRRNDLRRRGVRGVKSGEAISLIPGVIMGRLVHPR